MPITNPAQLVDEFKKSGEFDRLRRELLAQFRSGEAMGPFMARVDDIARQKLTSDQRLHYMPEAAVNRELMQELDRYPIVERAIADVRMLSDPAFAAGIRKSVNKILLEDRNRSEKPNIVNGTSQPSGSSVPDVKIDAPDEDSGSTQVEDMEIDEPQSASTSVVELPPTDTKSPKETTSGDEDPTQAMQLDSDSPT